MSSLCRCAGAIIVRASIAAATRLDGWKNAAFDPTPTADLWLETDLYRTPNHRMHHTHSSEPVSGSIREIGRVNQWLREVVIQNEPYESQRILHDLLQVILIQLLQC